MLHMSNLKTGPELTNLTAVGSVESASASTRLFHTLSHIFPSPTSGSSPASSPHLSLPSISAKPVHIDFNGKKVYGVALTDIESAAQRLKGFALITPVLTSTFFNEEVGDVNIYFKCENFQKIGAFKFRGAFSTVRKHLESHSKIKPNDLHVVTHSSGNHAQALALAAKLCGAHAHIVMPKNSPLVKKNAVQGYGAKIYECEPTQPAREKMANELINKIPNSLLIPPYDSLDIIAGQGTLGLEFFQQIPTLDFAIIPVGGGGMLSGICIALKALKPTIRIYAAEPFNVNDCAQSYSANKRITLPERPLFTIADGLRTSLGELTWPIIRDHIDGVLTVNEIDIINSMKLVFERMKIVIEPSAAVGVAAIRSKNFQQIKNQWKNLKENTGRIPNVGVIICGGNVDLDELPWIKNNK